MPSNIPATTIRIDPEVKKETTVILDEPGLSMSTAVNAFLRALVREGGMPFEMKVKSPAPDGETIGYKEYLRLAGLVANTPSTDLQALCSLDLRGHIHLNDVEKESLAQNGWLIYAGQEVLEFDSLSENDLQKSDDQLYKASKSAVSFVNLMRSKTDKGPI